jgi:beta-fructofuranosidase
VFGGPPPDLRSEDDQALAAVAGRALEIEARFHLGHSNSLEMRVLASPDGKEATVLRYDRSGILTIDRSRSSLDPSAYRHPLSGRLELDGGESLRIRVFVDHSIVEVFANDRLCLTARIYPSREDSTLVGLRADGGQARLESLRAWEMKSIWP